MASGMNLLLDTHIFLWFVTDDTRLTSSHRDAIRDPENLVFLSSISALEIAIKSGIGKLPLPEAPRSLIPSLRRDHEIAELPLDEASALAVSDLPLHHRDPFDRVLVSQANTHHLTLVTDDPLIHKYTVTLL